MKFHCAQSKRRESTCRFVWVDNNGFIIANLKRNNSIIESPKQTVQFLLEKKNSGVSIWVQ